MTRLRFAQISDIHISVLGDHHDMLSGRSAEFLAEIIADLNQIEDLDFVLFTGDIFDQADPTEFDQFRRIVGSLTKKYYVIPGNHDRRPTDRREGLTRREFARQFNPQFQARPETPEAQVGYWSITIKPGVQLIGLDSVIDEDWGGRIDSLQIEWLQSELITHADKLILLAVHHPFHRLSPIDDEPAWTNFVCDNGPEMLTLLDDYPQVKLVLTGHHHLTSADFLGRRLHLACPAISIYPCAYRLLRLNQQSDNSWQIEWQTVAATDPATIAEAREIMKEVWLDVGFGPDFVESYLRQVAGDPEDRQSSAIL